MVMEGFLEEEFELGLEGHMDWRGGEKASQEMDEGRNERGREGRREGGRETEFWEAKSESFSEPGYGGRAQDPQHPNPVSDSRTRVGLV